MTARKGQDMTTNDPTDRPRPKPRRRHGLGADGIEALRSRQDGNCAICEKPETGAPGGRLARRPRSCPLPRQDRVPRLRARSPVRELQQPPPIGPRRPEDPAGGHRVPRRFTPQAGQRAYMDRRHRCLRRRGTGFGSVDTGWSGSHDRRMTEVRVGEQALGPALPTLTIGDGPRHVAMLPGLSPSPGLPTGRDRQLAVSGWEPLLDRYTVYRIGRRVRPVGTDLRVHGRGCLDGARGYRPARGSHRSFDRRSDRIARCRVTA